MNKKKKDFLIFTLGFQFLFCTVLYISVLGLKNINSTVYQTIRNEFLKNISKNYITSAEYKPDGLKPVIGSTTETTALYDNVVETENTENTEKSEVTEQIDTVSSNVILNTSTENDLLFTVEGGISDENGYGITSENEIPENVSVRNYSINSNIINPLEGEVTSPFGMRTHPIRGENSFHAGIDIAAEEGTPILAPFDGIVKVAEYDEWNGYYLKIEHSGNIMTVFCHCSQLLVDEGDTISAGDTIALVGSTGSSTGPHLHFELRHNNVSYDPQIALNTVIDEV